MDGYLQSDPILWVKSDVYLKFLARRMAELKNMQLRIAKIQPENYITLTYVVMHLIRYTVITPIPMVGFLKDALVDLHFGSIIDRYGIFFLQELELNGWTIWVLQGEDCQEAKQFMKDHQPKNRRPRLEPNTCPTATYPLGEAPSWAEVVTTMDQNPELLILGWLWDPTLGNHKRASTLFIQFTVEIWMSLLPNVFSVEEPPHPDSVEDAMETWTLRSLQETLVNPVFVASNHNLEGPISGQRSKSFRDMFKVFFPPPGTKFHPSSVWLPFVNAGYIQDYFDDLEKLSDERKGHLHQALYAIFDKLQCLPFAIRCSEKHAGKIWDVNKGSIRFTTNPLYYRLQRIGPPNRARARAAVKVKATADLIEARLMEERGGVPVKITKRRQRDRRRGQRRTSMARAKALKKAAMAGARALRSQGQRRKGGPKTTARKLKGKRRARTSSSSSSSTSSSGHSAPYEVPSPGHGGRSPSYEVPSPGHGGRSPSYEVPSPGQSENSGNSPPPSSPTSVESVGVKVNAP
jgi:hypothetical protein